MNNIGRVIEKFEYNYDSGLFDYVDATHISRSENFESITKLIELQASKPIKKEFIELIHSFEQLKERESKKLNIELESLSGYRNTYSISVVRLSNSVLKGQIKLVSHIPIYFESKGCFETLTGDYKKGVVITDQSFNVLMVNDLFKNILGLSDDRCFGNNIFRSNLSLKDLKVENSIQKILINKSRYSKLIVLKNDIGEHVLFDMEVIKFISKDKDIFYIFNFTVLEGNNKVSSIAEKKYSLKDIHLPSETRFRSEINEKVIQDSCYLCISLLPDFCKSSREKDEVNLALGLKSLGTNNDFGYFGDGVFVIVLEVEVDELLAIGGLSRMIRRFKRRLRDKVNEKVYQQVLNGKVGVDLCGIDSTSVDEAITNSLLALQSHDISASQFNFYDHEIYKESVRKRRLEALVVNLVRTRQIDVHFQPIVSLNTGRIVKFEGLCRFHQVESEFSVQEMIFAAEALGVVHTLDRLVCEKAMSYFKEILTKCEDEVCLSVNCSLLDSDHGLQYLSDLFNLIVENKNKPNQIGIEITESSYFGNSLNNSNLINSIRSKGVQILVDDFGTGSSSFSYFSDFQFDVLKVDRNYIQDIHLSRQKYFAVKMLVELSHELGIVVVAEGVECQEELEILQDFGVDYVQGYLFSKPLSFQSIMAVKEINDLINNQDLLLKHEHIEQPC